MTEMRIPVKVTLSPEVQDRLDAALLAAKEFTQTMEALRAENRVLRQQVEALQRRLKER